MNEQDARFSPEKIDVQIEQLLQHRYETSSNARIIADLHAAYAEDNAIVQHVWQRLAGYRAKNNNWPKESQPDQSLQEAEEEIVPTNVATNNVKRKSEVLIIMPIHKDKQEQKKSAPWLAFLAVAVLVTLFASTLFLFKVNQSGQAAAQVSAKTDPAGIYLTSMSGIDKINQKTGKVAWHAGIGETGEITVNNNVVVFGGLTIKGPTLGTTPPLYEDSQASSYIEAVNATTGKQLWRLANTSWSELRSENGIVYDSACDESTNGSAEPCHLVAFQMASGKQLWSRPLPDGSAWITVQNGTVYVVSYTSFYALKGSNGQQIWQKTLTTYPDQQASVDPLVSGNALYFTSCNTLKTSQAFRGCYLFAVNIANGSEIWHQKENVGNLFNAIVSTGTIYVETTSNSILAFETVSGKPLGSYIVPDNLAGTGYTTDGSFLYVLTAQTDHISLDAINIQSKIQAWKKDVTTDLTEPVVSGGLVYIVSGNTIQAFNPQGASVHSYNLTTPGIPTGQVDITIIP